MLSERTEGEVLSYLSIYYVVIASDVFGGIEVLGFNLETRLIKQVVTSFVYF